VDGIRSLHELFGSFVQDINVKSRAGAERVQAADMVVVCIVDKVVS